MLFVHLTQCIKDQELFAGNFCFCLIVFRSVYIYLFVFLLWVACVARVNTKNPLDNKREPVELQHGENAVGDQVCRVHCVRVDVTLLHSRQHGYNPVIRHIKTEHHSKDGEDNSEVGLCDLARQTHYLGVIHDCQTVDAKAG